MMRPFFVGAISDNSIVNRSAPFNNENAEAALQLKVMPNPFSNYVTIQLHLNETKKLLIELYDEKGSMVRKIVDGTRPAGLNNISIDGSNMANGIYFCRINVNGETFLRKLVLQK